MTVHYSEADMPAKSEPVNDDKIKTGTWTPGNHCVIEWTALPEPPFYAAQYRKVAEVYEQADVPKLAAAKEMYEALQAMKSAMLDVLDFSNLPDDILTAADDALEKAEKAMQKARGER